MKRQIKIFYDRQNDVIEAGAIHPDDLKDALKEIVSCLKGMNVGVMGMFGSLFLDRDLSDEDLLLINLTISDDYKVVTGSPGVNRITSA
tara:strand:- start:119 stop:385 length:267 start_codon:yes stop_codon:yes gene_type:complete